jgi:uncharacterized protein DUF6519
MKGDFSRRTVARGKYYRAVLMQQGRVELDADRNEQNDVSARSEHAPAALPDVPPPGAKARSAARKRP